MKAFVSSLLLFSAVLGLAQGKKSEAAEGRVIGTAIINRYGAGEKPNGSPYLQKMFTSAKVQNIPQNTFLRYNVFNDEFEFISSKNDTLIMDKIEDFSTVTFNGTNRTYVLTPYIDPKNKLVYGYLINLHEKNGYVLFMKENVVFYEGKKAKTTLERDMPARYSKTDDTFFLKNKDKGVAEFPDGKKALIKLFPDRKAAIETFLKENKLSFTDRADLIKIVDFVAGL